jgi:hypothetical protein
MDTVIEVEGIHIDEQPDTADAPDLDNALSDLGSVSLEMEGQIQTMDLPPYIWHQLNTQQIRVKMLPWFLGEWCGEGWVETLKCDGDEAYLSCSLYPESVEFSQPQGLGARLLRWLWGAPFLRPAIRFFTLDNNL